MPSRGYLHHSWRTRRSRGAIGGRPLDDSPHEQTSIRLVPKPGYDAGMRRPVCLFTVVMASMIPACGGGTSPSWPTTTPLDVIFVTGGVSTGSAPPAAASLPPLPPGWAWPFNPAVIARQAPTVYRPINVASLRAARAQTPPGACAPFEVAPSVWVTPLCTALGIGRSVRGRSLQGAPGAGSERVRIRPRAELPQAIDLRTLGLEGPVKDQQAAPVCWSFAFSSIMENALRRAGRGEVVAPLHLVSHDEWREVTRTGAGHGTALEPTWPYDPHKACELDRGTNDSRSCETAYGIQRGSWQSDPIVVGELGRAEASNAFKISAIAPLQDSPGNPDEVASVLATGQAVYAELDINMSAWSVWRQGPGATIADWEPDGVGGHAVTLSGYFTANGMRSFLLHNSWGASWGDGGYAWISEQMLRDRLRDAWTITLSDARGRVVTPRGTLPAPVPVPAPVVLPPSASRTHCTLAGMGAGASHNANQRVAVDDAVCTNESANVAARGTWLSYCRKVSSGTSTCGLQKLAAVPVCLAAVMDGHSRAACCPANATSPTDPRCVTPDAQSPRVPGD